MESVQATPNQISHLAGSAGQKMLCKKKKQKIAKVKGRQAEKHIVLTMSAEANEKSIKGQRSRKTGCQNYSFLADSKFTKLKVNTKKN